MEADYFNISGEAVKIVNEDDTPLDTDKYEDEISKLESIMNNLQEAKVEVEMYKLRISARCDGELKPSQSEKLTSLFNCINEAIIHLSYFIYKSKKVSDNKKDEFESKSLKNEDTSTIPEEMLKVEIKDDYENDDVIDDHFADTNSGALDATIFKEDNSPLDIAVNEDIDCEYVKKEDGSYPPVGNIKVDEDASEDPLEVTTIKSEPHTSISQKIIPPQEERSRPQGCTYKCISCAKVFKRYLSFKKHIETDKCGNTEALIECHLCQKNFTNPWTLKKHVERLHEGKREIVNCQVCGKKMNKGSLREHMFLHTEATFQCRSCPRKFVTEAIMTRHHKFVHEDYKPYKCEICGKGFNNKCQLEVHSVVHTGEKPHTCDQCGNSYSQKTHLRTHIKKAHEGIKMKTYVRQKVMCVECGKLLQSRAKLEAHILIVHKGIKMDQNKQLACGKCDKLFSSRQSLQKHEKIHTTSTLDERRTISCPSCTTTFTLKENLRRHIRAVHEGIKPHSCEVCEKKFASKNEVKEHMTMHTGEKAYKCDECGKCFSQMSSLCGHKKKSHREKGSSLGLTNS